MEGRGLFLGRCQLQLRKESLNATNEFNASSFIDGTKLRQWIKTFRRTGNGKRVLKYLSKSTRSDFRLLPTFYTFCKTTLTHHHQSICGPSALRFSTSYHVITLNVLIRRLVHGDRRRKEQTPRNYRWSIAAVCQCPVTVSAAGCDNNN